MVTLGIVAVLATIAVPNMRDFVLNGRLTGAANDLLHSYQLARTEAIKRQQNVVVCATATPTSGTCSYGTFATGWMVFADVDGDGQRTSTEPLIESHDALDSGVFVTNDNNYSTGFVSSGVLSSGPPPNTLTVTICDSRGNTKVGTNSTARALLVTPQTGRARVTKIYKEVSKSTACP
jgi:Tfp pilus assembly protein FimT